MAIDAIRTGGLNLAVRLIVVARLIVVVRLNVVVRLSPLVGLVVGSIVVVRLNVVVKPIPQGCRRPWSRKPVGLGPIFG